MRRARTARASQATASSRSDRSAHRASSSQATGVAWDAAAAAWCPRPTKKRPDECCSAVNPPGPLQAAPGAAERGVSAAAAECRGEAVPLLEWDKRDIVDARGLGGSQAIITEGPPGGNSWRDSPAATACALSRSACLCRSYLADEARQLQSVGVARKAVTSVPPTLAGASDLSTRRMRWVEPGLSPVSHSDADDGHPNSCRPPSGWPRGGNRAEGCDSRRGLRPPSAAGWPGRSSLVVTPAFEPIDSAPTTDAGTRGRRLGRA